MPTNEQLPKAETHNERKEFANGLAIFRPIGADLFYVGAEPTNLPLEIASDPRLLEQARERRVLYQNLRQLFDRIVDVNLDFDEAVDQGLLRPGELALAYNQMAAFLAEDDNHGRIILYLPTQFLPHLNRPLADEALAAAQTRFGEAYRNAWIRLLFESDCRADFTDGDILEPGMGEPERIRKAAHLAADLIERDLIWVEDIFDILAINGEEAELQSSLTEGLAVAYDRGIISQTDYGKVQSLLRQSSCGVSPEESGSLGEIIGNLEIRLKTVEAKYETGSVYASKISPERANWEKQVRRNEVVDQAAMAIASKLQKGEIRPEEIEAFSDNEVGLLSTSRGIIMAGEDLARTNLDFAREFAQGYQPLIQRNWTNGTLETRDVILSGLNHWQRLGLVEASLLDQLGIPLPDLCLPFPVKLEELAGDFQFLLEAAVRIKADPALSAELAPLFLALGSRVKGQAGLATDFDGAVFWGPGAIWENRDAAFKRLYEAIPELRKIDKLLEYLLEDRGGRIWFRQPLEEIDTVMGARELHFLLNGVFIGDSSGFMALNKEICGRYLNLARFGEQKEEVRTSLLRQVEIDTLQYRLIHKGYSKFYPCQREESTSNSGLIDWKSDYWDPGYRRVASLLFVSRVFLPDLSA